MLASAIVQRTNLPNYRAAALFVALTIASITVICGLFLLFDAPIPSWFTVVGRWLPALITLIVLRVIPLSGGLAHWWGLRAGGWRRLFAGSLSGVLLLLAIYVVAAVSVSLLELGALLGPAELGSIALILPVAVVAFALSTFGEEVAWRGFLQRTLAEWGFWRAAGAVALVWVVFHIPLHGAMAVQGVLPRPAAVTSTVLLFPLGVLLSALVERWGCVWPAVFAHALPMTALNLLQDPGSLPLSTQLIVTTVSGGLMLGVALVLRQRRRNAPTHDTVAALAGGPAQ